VRGARPPRTITPLTNLYFHANVCGSFNTPSA